MPSCETRRSHVDTTWLRWECSCGLQSADAGSTVNKGKDQGGKIGTRASLLLTFELSPLDALRCFHTDILDGSLLPSSKRVFVWQMGDLGPRRRMACMRRYLVEVVAWPLINPPLRVSPGGESGEARELLES